MRIVYTTNFGRFKNSDFSVTEVAAEVPSGEHFDALNQGFLFFNKKWRLVRSVRINLEKTQYNEFSGAKRLYSYNDELDNINTLYCQHKGYDKTDIDISEYDNIWGYYTDKLVAFSIVHQYNGAMESRYFAWDYVDSKLRMGIVSLEHEIAVAKSLGYKYYYLGPGYESSSKYKCEFDGFEWYTGSEWSTDKELYKSWCDRDSSIEDINQLSFSK